MNLVDTPIGKVDESDLAIRFVEVDDAEQFARVETVVHVPTGQVIHQKVQSGFRKVNAFKDHKPEVITVELPGSGQITEMATGGLERRLSVQDDYTSFASVIEYLLDGVVVHRSANVCIKRTPDMASAMGQIG